MKVYTHLYIFKIIPTLEGFPRRLEVKASACNAGRSPGEGNGNPFKYSCLENPMDGGA